ncbi:MAG TPA: hypothetical protein VGM91_18790 [Conexibacter sp.]|jgi:hypothetical protein
MPDGDSSSGVEARAALERALAQARLDDMPAALQQAVTEALVWLGRLEAEAAAGGGADALPGRSGRS